MGAFYSQYDSSQNTPTDNVIEGGDVSAAPVASGKKRTLGSRTADTSNNATRSAGLDKALSRSANPTQMYLSPGGIDDAHSNKYAQSAEVNEAEGHDTYPFSGLNSHTQDRLTDQAAALGTAPFAKQTFNSPPAEVTGQGDWKPSASADQGYAEAPSSDLSPAAKLAWRIAHMENPKQEYPTSPSLSGGFGK